ncbi:MAG: regulatory protein RecX [Rhodospirillales bacterium]
MAEKGTRRGPRKATAHHLENKALYYLARFATSQENLRRVLMRAVLLSASHHGTDIETGARDIVVLLDKLTGRGLLNDAAYAESRARALRRRGLSARTVRGRLLAYGLDGELIIAALEAVDEHGGGELAAATALARRRGLGPYRRTKREKGSRDKDLAALARAGFSYKIARTVIAAPTPKDLEVLITEGE